MSLGPQMGQARSHAVRLDCSAAIGAWRPDRPELPHRDMVPMVMMQEIPDNKTAELLRREAIRERPTPDHPDTGTGGEVVHVNGPWCKPTYAVGSLEWQHQQENDGDA